MTEIDKWFPELGPCLICGTGLDQRHRVLDAICDRVAGGEGEEDVAADYDLPVEAVQAAVAEWNPRVGKLLHARLPASKRSTKASVPEAPRRDTAADLIRGLAGIMDVQELAAKLHDAMCSDTPECARRQGHHDYYQQRAESLMDQLEPRIGAANVWPVTQIVIEELL